MPLTLIITEGLLAKHRHPETIASLSNAFLKLHGLAGNKFMTPNVIGHITEIAAGNTYAGMEQKPVAIVEWLTPSFAFGSREIQRTYVAEATEILFQACEQKIPKASIWVNLKYAVDGMWGIAGTAYTNEELGAAIAQG